MRAIASLSLAAVLVLLAFETGVHSAHHVSAGDAGPLCAVAAATAHLVGVPIDTATVHRVVLSPCEIAPIDRVQAPALPLLFDDRTRAPPITA